MNDPNTHLKKNQDLYQSCIFGGNLERIKKLTAENKYSKAELEHAISVLESSISSALENMTAKEAIDYLNKIIMGMDLLDKIKKK